MEITDKSTTESSAKETTNSDSSKLFEQWPAGKTPFTINKLENKFWLSLGKYRLTEILDSREACERDAKRKDWIRIMQIMQAVLTEHELQKAELEKTIKEQKAKIEEYEETGVIGKDSITIK